MTLRRITFWCTVAATLAACGPPATPMPRDGALAAGSAAVDMGGDPLNSRAVECTTVSDRKTLSVSLDKARVETVIDTGRGLSVVSVSFDDVAGFTGSTWQHLQGDAVVDMTGSTFRVKGTAEGFDNRAPSQRVSRKFSLTVAC